MKQRAWLFVLSLLCSLAVWSADETAPRQIVEGVFTILYGDPEPSSGEKSQRLPILATDDGRRIELDLTGVELPPGGIFELVNRRVRVEGHLDLSKAATAGPRLRARSVEPLPVAVPKITGTQKFVSVLCKFAGNSAEPRPPAYFTTQLGATYPGFNHYFREASYDTLNLDGSAAASAWVNMPRPLSFYIDGTKQPNVYLNELFNDCTAAASAIVDFSSYYGVNLMFNDKIGNAAWGGGQWASLSGQEARMIAATWMPYWGEANDFGWRNHGVLGHEMAHAFRAPHSGAPNGYEYGSGWDVVSDPAGGRYFFGQCPRKDAAYGCVSQSMNAYAKHVMGILPAARLAVHNGGSGTYNIERLAQPANAAGTFLGVRVVLPNDPNRFYIIESRFRAGYDAGLPGDGVVIHEINTTRDPPAWLVTPPGMPVADGNLGPVWRPGMTFLSASDNLSITINSFSATGTANVTVGPHAAVTDNWPSGCALPTGWTTSAGAAAGWEATNTLGAYGNCSLRSATLAPPSEGTARAAIEFTGAFAEGNVTFLARVSGTGGDSCLRFTIDDAQQNIGACGSSGLGLTAIANQSESGWQYFSFPVTAGTHKLAWSFEKTSAGGAPDTAWIDSMTLPTSNGLALSVAKAGTGNGTITSAPNGIDCGALCAAPFAAGATVTLQATAAAGSQFTGWSGACTGTGSCTVTLNAATSVTANFAAAPTRFAVTAARHGSGSVVSEPAGIDCGSTCTAAFEAGTTITLNAVPADGAAFGGWAGACTGTDPCRITVNAATQVVATFLSALEMYTVNIEKHGTGAGSVVSDPAGINCGQNCVGTFRAGTEVTLTATPAARSTFRGWGEHCEGSESTCTLTVDENMDVSAMFDLITHAVTVTRTGTGTGTVTSAPEGIACGGTCSFEFTAGSVVTLTASAQPGSQFAGWSGACSGTGPCTVTVNAAADVTATFTAATASHTLTVAKAGTGGGTVSTTPSGIACGSACSASFAAGAMVTLTATPAAGSTFAGWSGACSGTSACAVTMNAAASVTATFTAINHTLSLTKQGTGSGTVDSAPAGISCGAACSASFASGTAVTLTATPASGSIFAGWGGACSGTSTCTVTLASARSVTATFNPAPASFALTVTRAGSGSGSVASAPGGITCGTACSASYGSGTTVRLTASAAAGSVFAGWSGACSGTSDCIVTLAAAANVTATFNAIPGALVTITPAGTGSGTVTSTPGGISCGTTCFATFTSNATVTLAAAPGTGSTFAGWSGACTGTGTCSFTADAAKTVTATFNASIQSSPSALDFGGQSMRTTSPARTVRFSNPSNVIVQTSGVSASAGFAVDSSCHELSPGGSCVATVTFTPQSEGSISGTLTLLGGASPLTVALAGVGERSLVTHYYRSILGRAPDPAGKAFWEAEASRVVTLGANVNEAWYALAGAFYTSAEYLAFNRSDADFVNDIYRTFFARNADAAGRAYWVGQITGGMPREVVLSSFMFSAEFVGFTQGIFGVPSVRAESNTVMDFFRGALGRLPDSAGYNFWVQQFRTAQCQGQSAVLAAASSISGQFFESAEYGARNRSNSQYVGDLYNGFLRRGGDLEGVRFWINQLASGGMTRKQLREAFYNSPEFGARVNAIVGQGCLR